MIKLLTPVEIPQSRYGISFDDKILIIGSCFADNVGRKMAEAGFDVMVNPFGTLYNPQSVANSLERLKNRTPFSKTDCVKMGSGAEMTCSFSHHTSFARKTAEEFLENANASLERASDFFRNCNRMIITFGTAWCYRHAGSGEIVSNCLKRRADEFTRERMSPQDITDLFSNLISSTNKGCKTIFTVSPIRHLKDGAHGNQLSKSTLLLAIEDLVGRLEDCSYFPAYEIVLDELRDYRFYSEDLVHPSPTAVEYIWEKFCDSYMSPQVREKARLNIKEYKRSLHRQILI